MDKRMTIVVATDDDGAIGLQGRLPWDHPLDLHFFFDQTKRCASDKSVLIIGRKTYDGIPAGFKNRTVIVVTSQPTLPRAIDGLQDVSYATWVETLGVIWHYIGTSNRRFVIAGGAQIYERAAQGFPDARLCVTKIAGKHTADTYLGPLMRHMCATVLPWRTIHPLSFCVKPTVAPSWETPYLDLIWKILTEGNKMKGRNGITKSLFAQQLRFDLQDVFPLMTTKRVFFRGIFEELLFFLQGKTDATELEAKGVHIWHDNTTREFLDGRHLDYPVGCMGPMYGYNWRHYGRPYTPDEPDQATHQSTNIAQVDQFARILQILSSDPSSRRAHMTTVNPLVLDQGVLEPCHGLATIFKCTPLDHPTRWRLSCFMAQRSCDMICGVPFNVASYALLVHIMCGLLNTMGVNQFVPGELVIDLVDAHIYAEHYDVAARQALRESQGKPKIYVPNLTMRDTNFLVANTGRPLEFTDVCLTDYNPCFKLEAKMIA